MLTGWTALTEGDVLNQFNDSEQTAYDTAKGDANGVAIADIIQKVADQIWLAYSQGGRNVDTQGAGTIPAGEKNRAIALVRFKYLLALPTGKSLAENRQAEAKQAEDYLLKISQRQIKAAGGATAIRPSCQNFHGFKKIGST